MWVNVFIRKSAENKVAIKVIGRMFSCNRTVEDVYFIKNLFVNGIYTG